MLRNNLGLIRQAKGDVGQAEQLFRQAMALNQAAGHPAAEASNHVNLGILAEERREYEVAEREFERALELDKSRGAPGGDCRRSLCGWAGLQNGGDFPIVGWPIPSGPTAVIWRKGIRLRRLRRSPLRWTVRGDWGWLQEVARLEKELIRLTGARSGR
jgi:tetratricopeptide (TPR) repeat protein